MRIFVSLVLFSVTNLDFASSVIVGDKVLVRQDKNNKLTTTFGATPFTVINKSTNSLLVESPDGVQYSRNTTHVTKYQSDVDAASREETDSHWLQTKAREASKTRSRRCTQMVRNDSAHQLDGHRQPSHV